ncbi:GNAT family N-acetyltransferase [Paenibacillus wulumuqiensis]|uniref:GNAT family N-acetyltransferase n=1 Tax=Paenibacillus wulumuqiensis TaxID=1567107 RepID=UPI0006195CE9|nr:GNAT family N-acetyltransferase [Paenibacillus wulumuqiensis]
MINDWQIVHAAADHAKALAEMNLEFNGVTMEEEPLRHYLENRREIILVALDQNEAVGFACAQVFHSFCYERPNAEITELYVREAARQQGVAGRLVRRVEEELRAAGVKTVTILTGSYNEPAWRTYESAGYRAQSETVFQRKLIPME